MAGSESMTRIRPRKSGTSERFEAPGWTLGDDVIVRNEGTSGAGELATRVFERDKTGSEEMK